MGHKHENSAHLSDADANIASATLSLHRRAASLSADTMPRINVADATKLDKLMLLKLPPSNDINALVRAAAYKLAGDNQYELSGSERLFLLIDSVRLRVSEVTDVDDIDEGDTVVISFDGSDVVNSPPPASPPEASAAEKEDSSASTPAGRSTVKNFFTPRVANTSSDGRRCTAHDNRSRHEHVGWERWYRMGRRPPLDFTAGPDSHQGTLVLVPKGVWTE